jgi:hypothetical protein
MMGTAYFAKAGRIGANSNCLNCQERALGMKSSGVFHIKKQLGNTETGTFFAKKDLFLNVFRFPETGKEFLQNAAPAPRPVALHCSENSNPRSY